MRFSVCAEFLAELAHRRVGLELGIGLDDRHQAAERRRPARLRRRRARRSRRHRRAAGAPRRRPGPRRVARGDHRLERVLLVLQVALARRLDEVGDQVVAALELHVDLREGVGDLVAPAHEAVVGDDRPRGPTSAATHKPDDLQDAHRHVLARCRIAAHCTPAPPAAAEPTIQRVMNEPTADEVRDYIAAGLRCEHLEVEGDGRHFFATIVVAGIRGTAARARATSASTRRWARECASKSTRCR